LVEGGIGEHLPSILSIIPIHIITVFLDSTEDLFMEVNVIGLSQPI